MWGSHLNMGFTHGCGAYMPGYWIHTLGCGFLNLGHTDAMAYGPCQGLDLEVSRFLGSIEYRTLSPSLSMCLVPHFSEPFSTAMYSNTQSGAYGL